MPAFVIIGNPGSNRIALFQAALQRLAMPTAHVVSWIDLLNERVHLGDVIQTDDVVRIESPGREFDVERALLLLGAAQDDTDGGLYERCSRETCLSLEFDKGRILWPRQWYLGFCSLLDRVSQQLLQCPKHHLSSSPLDIKTMFDKRLCHARLSEQGIPVPHALASVTDFADLTGQMEQAHCPRVFVKLAHGSSASGVVAYQTNGKRHLATTTTEMMFDDGRVGLYNSRHLRTYRDPGKIATLIDTLCRHRVHVEQWLPKAGIDGHSFDLRVVVIDGKAMHTVVRMSKSPLTNLHLLNSRGDVAAVQARMGLEAWQHAMATCEQAMQAFPHSMMTGIDLLISSDFQHHAVLEVNAFGDLLPNVLFDGMDTYEAQIRALAQRYAQTN